MNSEAQEEVIIDRAFRRRLKRMLRMSLTPSVEFATAYLRKMELAGAIQRVPADGVVVKKPMTKRAFEGAEDA